MLSSLIRSFSSRRDQAGRISKQETSTTVDSESRSRKTSLASSLAEDDTIRSYSSDEENRFEVRRSTTLSPKSRLDLRRMSRNYAVAQLLAEGDEDNSSIKRSGRCRSLKQRILGRSSSNKSDQDGSESLEIVRSVLREKLARVNTSGLVPINPSSFTQPSDINKSATMLRISDPGSTQIYGKQLQRLKAKTSRGSLKFQPIHTKPTDDLDMKRHKAPTRQTSILARPRPVRRLGSSLPRISPRSDRARHLPGYQAVQRGARWEGNLDAILLATRATAHLADRPTYEVSQSVINPKDRTCLEPGVYVGPPRCRQNIPALKNKTNATSKSPRTSKQQSNAVFYDKPLRSVKRIERRKKSSLMHAQRDTTSFALKWTIRRVPAFLVYRDENDRPVPSERHSSDHTISIESCDKISSLKATDQVYNIIDDLLEIYKPGTAAGVVEPYTNEDGSEGCIIDNVSPSKAVDHLYNMGDHLSHVHNPEQNKVSTAVEVSGIKTEDCIYEMIDELLDLYTPNSISSGRRSHSPQSTSSWSSRRLSLLSASENSSSFTKAKSLISHALVTGPSPHPISFASRLQTLSIDESIRLLSSRGFTTTFIAQHLWNRGYCIGPGGVGRIYGAYQEQWVEDYLVHIRSENNELHQ